MYIMYITNDDDNSSDDDNDDEWFNKGRFGA